MVWFNTFDDTFFTSIAVILVGVVGLSIRFCYRSKCYRIECGCIKIYRDTEDEKEIDEMVIETHVEEDEKESV
jgi:uncharacterized membrane protein